MAGSADWSIAVGVLVFMVAIVFATIFYLRFGKISLIAFTASIATYIFAVFYTWDVFELNRNWVLIMLLVSTFVMVFLGKYFSSVKFKPSKMHTSLKEKESN